MSAPIPFDAPVTTAIFPASFPFFIVIVLGFSGSLYLTSRLYCWQKKRCSRRCHSGWLGTQYIHRDFFKVPEQFEVVLSAGLGERAVVTSKQRLRFRLGVWCLNQALRMSVPNRRLKIFYLPIKNAVNGIAHDLVLRAHLAPNT